MPYLATAQEWYTQSALLVEARPTTTRITTKYSLKRPSARSRARTNKSRKTAEADGSSAVAATADVANVETPTVVPPPLPARATLTLKTYDPNSGAVLKYQTDKAAEVGRLISSLSRLGRGMAGLPELEDVAMLDAGLVDAPETGSGIATPVGGEGPAKASGPGQQAGGAQGGKKGKKKGKK